MKNILAILGTNHSKSTNRKLLEYIQTQFFHKANITIQEINEVPLINYDSNTIPEIVSDIEEKIKKSDAVIIACPEYDHMPTSALLNLLAWISFKNATLKNKPLLIVGASHGALGSIRAQTFLRQILSAPNLDPRIFPKGFLLGYSKIAFDEWGDLRGRKKINELEEIFNEFLKYIDIINESIDRNLINNNDFIIIDKNNMEEQ